MRPWQIWRHAARHRPADDVLVFQEDDERFYVDVGRTRSGRFLVITTASKITTEVWLVDADDADRAAGVVEPREQGHEYHVEHHRGPGGDRFLVLTNADGAENFELMARRRAHPGGRSGPCSSRTAPTSASTTSTRSPATSCCPSAPKGSSRSGCCSSIADGASSTTT